MANGTNPSPWQADGLFTITWTNPPSAENPKGVLYKLGTPPASNDDGVFVTGPSFTITATWQGIESLYLWIVSATGKQDYRQAVRIELRVPISRYVDAGNTSGIEDGSQASPYRTIQAAIDQTVNMTGLVAIHVGPGNYHGVLTLRDNLLLVGSGPDLRPSLLTDMGQSSRSPERELRSRSRASRFKAEEQPAVGEFTLAALGVRP